ncbi:MAG: adenylyltransferase/cytidyltransferase family protein [Chloroflexaceae bacterium]|nr:adenylyltransferase/cytidyltransferase family protein [Chloroflexaceae bacterium]
MVFTNGVFDLLHSGHVFYLEEARRLGDILVVGINSDASTRAIKGPTRPLISEHDRAYMLAALRTVDYVTIFSETTAEALVDTLRPDIYVKGGDYALDPAQRAALAVDVQRLPEARVVMAYGGQVQLIPTRQGCSTSALIARILATAS